MKKKLERWWTLFIAIAIGGILTYIGSMLILLVGRVNEAGYVGLGGILVFGIGIIGGTIVNVTLEIIKQREEIARLNKWVEKSRALVAETNQLGAKLDRQIEEMRK